MFLKKLNFTENCSSEQTFIVYVDPPSDVNSCSAYTLPALIVGEYRTTFWWWVTSP
jgi:hypothetical protein